MIAVCDASPLHYLILVDEVELLQTFFERLLIPEAVFGELDDPGTPLKVRRWMSHPPSWLQMRAVALPVSSGFLRLDRGEREAIQLALESGARVVVMDETAGRLEATRMGLEVIGTLGILERGAQLGRINFRGVFAKLEQTSFRLSAAVGAAFLERNP